MDGEAVMIHDDECADVALPAEVLVYEVLEAIYQVADCQ